MTYDEVMNLYLEHAEAADEEHERDCPERTQEFVRCEACELGRRAKDKLMNNVLDIVKLLEIEHDARQELTLRVIQDVTPDERTPELQQAMMHSVRVGGGTHAHK